MISDKNNLIYQKTLQNGPELGKNRVSIEIALREIVHMQKYPLRN